MKTVRIKVKIPNKEREIFSKKKNNKIIWVLFLLCFCSFLSYITITNFNSENNLSSDSRSLDNNVGMKKNEVEKVVELKKVEPKVVELKKVEPKVVELKKVEPKVVELKKVEPKVVELKKVEPKVGENNIKRGHFAENVIIHGVNKREPFNILEENVIYDKNKLYFYLEIVNLKNKEIELVWKLENNELFRKKIKIKADRWRTWYSKNINSYFYNKKQTVELYLKDKIIYRKSIIINKKPLT